MLIAKQPPKEAGKNGYSNRIRVVSEILLLALQVYLHVVRVDPQSYSFFRRRVSVLGSAIVPKALSAPDANSERAIIFPAEH